MIQDSINQMLGVLGVAGAYAGKMRTDNATRAIASKEEMTKNEISSDNFNAKEKQASAFSHADTMQSDYGVNTVPGRDSFKNKLTRAFTPTAIKNAAMDSAVRMNNLAYDESKALEANKTAGQQIGAMANQADNYKKFVEMIAGGYSRHGKGQQLYNYTEQAKKLLEEGGNK